MTELIKTTSEIERVLSRSDRPIGFVPTMGALHDGHISLIKSSVNECKTTVVSIFVNPLQFGSNEDFEKYPRDLKSDLEVCRVNKVDYVFAPDREEMYPKKVEEHEIIAPPKELTSILCGKSRPGHFEGVATVVNKLFNIIQGDYAYFGEKDLQQLYVIRWLVKKFNLSIFVRACTTIREGNGLACSSRNKYLSKEEIGIASNLYKSLKLAKQNIRSGFFSISKAVLESLIFLSQFNEIKTEYFEARSKDDLSLVEDNVKSGFYFLLAGKVNNVRLIDNIEV